MKFNVICEASVNHDGVDKVLLRVYPPDNNKEHLLGDLLKPRGEFERDAIYRVTIEKIAVPTEIETD